MTNSSSPNELSTVLARHIQGNKKYSAIHMLNSMSITNASALALAWIIALFVDIMYWIGAVALVCEAAISPVIGMIILNEPILALT